MAWPGALTVQPWIDAWAHACTGLECQGISVGFWNSVRILVPSAILSIALGAVTGYTLSFWRVRGANWLFGILLAGAFMPYQIFLYPLVRLFSQAGIYNSLACIVIVHVIFGLPLMTLLFRNYYASLPIELFARASTAAAVFSKVICRCNPDAGRGDDPSSHWHLERFIFSLTLRPGEICPCVQLNNIVNSTQGERTYNTDMAHLPRLVPLWSISAPAAGSCAASPPARQGLTAIERSQSRRSR